MSSVDERPDAAAADIGTAARLSALERQVAELRAEIAQLHAAVRSEPVRMPPDVSALRLPPRPSTSRPRTATPRGPFAWARDAMRSASGGLELEAVVGRYGTLLLAALVIL